MDKKQIQQHVHDQLMNNLAEGHSEILGKDYSFIKPSPGTYPFQWFWDTCFHIFILCDLGESNLAKKSLESLFAFQEEDGFVGHMIFWENLFPPTVFNIVEARPTLRHLRPQMSALIQPPLAAQALSHIYHATGDKQFLQKMYPKIKKLLDWIEENRDFEGHGLISIISPFESGMDHKPSYDEVLGYDQNVAKDSRELFHRVLWVDTQNFLKRYDLEAIYKADSFIVKDVGFNSIYALDLYALSKLADELGEEGAELNKKADKVLDRLLEHCYDEDDMAFYDLYSHDLKKLKVCTPTIFFPMMLGDLPDKISYKLIENHLLNKKEFDAPFPIPSVSLSNPSFYPYETEEKYLWRGPTWIANNWFLQKCLQVRGYQKFADEMVSDAEQLIGKSGFREYYNPFSGEGYGAHNFTWSGLIVDMWETQNTVS